MIQENLDSYLTSPTSSLGGLDMPLLPQPFISNMGMTQGQYNAFCSKCFEYTEVSKESTTLHGNYTISLK